MQKLSDEERARILELAEDGARRESLKLRARQLSKPPSSNPDAPETHLDNTELRVHRAVKYANWRMGAYEAGECASPW